MATIKSYTDIEQSRELDKILPFESADMMYQEYETVIGDDYGYKYKIQPFFSPDIDGVPCWSLAALLSVLPKYELNNFGDTIQLDVNMEALATEGDETLLDLVVNMIIHLHELKML